MDHIFLAENLMSPISTRICVPNLVAVRRSCRKKGVQTDRQYRQTERQRETAALYNRLFDDYHTKYEHVLLLVV